MRHRPPTVAEAPEVDAGGYPQVLKNLFNGRTLVDEANDSHWAILLVSLLIYIPASLEQVRLTKSGRSSRKSRAAGQAEV